MDDSVLMKMVWDRKKKASPTVEGRVELRITYHRKQKYILTSVSVLPCHWKSGMVVGRRDAYELNESLAILMKNVRQVVNDMQEAGTFVFDEVPVRLSALRARNMPMWRFFRQRAEVRSYGKGPSVRYRYEMLIDWIYKWGVIGCFEDITDKVIVEMDAALARRGLKESTRWANYHKIFKALILDAVDLGYMQRNPYKFLHICRHRNDTDTLDRRLTAEELRRWRNSVMPTPALERVRDLFIFQCYTCMSYVDMSAFEMRNLRNVDGAVMYSGRRGKTGKPFTFVLLPPALEVLRKYSGRLPMISNVKYNLMLKIVAQAVAIDKRVTTHWARHTGATLLLNAGVSMETVAKVLGHSSTAITRQVYAKLLDETVAREMLGIDI